MEKKWFIDIIIAIVIGLVATSCQTYSLKSGDLLFHVVSQGNAITDVTPGMIDHVAIVMSRDSVIEAVGKGVKMTPIDSLRQQDGHYLVGRVKGIDSKQSIANAKHYFGRPYDRLYLPNNDAIYCSELVQLSFVDKHGKRLFSPIPMSFHDTTGRITDYWRQFYAKHQLEVPEGEPGTNPGELSQRTNVKLKGRLR
ncbi:Permuted papain-like amidase enzyme, YaeF/YiiX, C92 family [Prevotellaceae bacterium HUN156]|nr:Permuted papain-like amidase enzyme, YaeF/YiiX, C92 family [Prevotellaceae bacterium HUN156]